MCFKCSSISTRFHLKNMCSQLILIHNGHGDLSLTVHPIERNILYIPQRQKV